MTFLITGAGGQLGSECALLLAAEGQAPLTFSKEALDVADEAAVVSVFERVRPQVVINCAAYTRVDRAESEPTEAHRANARGPEVLARACAAVDALLVHVSTDYVFDGTAGTPYTEETPTHPLGVYGKSKLLGELAVVRYAPRHLIVRTAWVHGVGGGNFVRTMLRLATEREELRVVDDQVGAPTWTRDLVAGMLALVTASAPSGFYHVTNSGVASWYDFAVAIVEEASRLGWPIATRRVVPIATVDYPTPAVRPAYSVLSRRKSEGVLGRPFPHWRVGLRGMLTQLRTQEAP
jgi:dTDP-4-dehydrorhamnose reductase